MQCSLKRRTMPVADWDAVEGEQLESQCLQGCSPPLAWQRIGRQEAGFPAGQRRTASQPAILQCARAWPMAGGGPPWTVCSAEIRRPGQPGRAARQVGREVRASSLRASSLDREESHCSRRAPSATLRFCNLRPRVSDRRLGAFHLFDHMPSSPRPRCTHTETPLLFHSLHRPKCFEGR